MNQISLKPSAIARILGAVAFLLVLANIGAQLSRFLLGNNNLKGLVPLFDVDAEGNIPTFFSMLLMISAALLLAVIAGLNGKQKTHDVSKWAILSVGFLYMAYDEAFQVHARLISPVQALLGSGTLGIFYIRLGNSWHCSRTRRRAVLPEIRVAFPCDSEAQVPDGGDSLPWRSHRRRDGRGPLC